MTAGSARFSLMTGLRNWSAAKVAGMRRRRCRMSVARIMMAQDYVFSVKVRRRILEGQHFRNKRRLSSTFDILFLTQRHKVTKTQRKDKSRKQNRVVSR